MLLEYDAIKISPLLQSAEMNRRDGLKKVCSFMGVYSLSELKKYFNSIKESEKDL